MPTATESGYATIAWSIDGGVATIRLNRPDCLNALNDEVTKELSEALKAAERDRAVRAVVITGAGRAFSSGQDLTDLETKYVPGYVPALGDDLRKRYNPIIRRIREMPKPVIAAVNGVAAGAGCSIALACDMRIASSDASFIEVFINVGLIPDSGSSFTLPRLIGLGRAMEMCMTGSRIDAEEAARIGLVNAVCAPEELEEAAAKLASKVARMPAVGLALTKRLLNRSFENDLASQLEAEAFAQETAGRTEDHFEGVSAFLAKRKPDFKGR